MKSIFISIAAAALAISAGAQVQVKPFPTAGYEKRISEYVDQLRVVDTHEHLANPESFSKSGMFDFMLLLHHYSDDDIKSAGMSQKDYGRLLTNSLTVKEKWEVIKPYWEGSSNTAYNRSVLLAADKLYGISDINGNTVEELSEKIRSSYQSDWFNHVLKDKCGLDYIIVDREDNRAGDPQIMRYVKRFDHMAIDSRPKIEAISKQQNISIKSLDDLVSALEKEFNTIFPKDYIAVKIAVAYSRILFFEDVPKEKAATAFNEIMASSDNNALPFDKVKPLQDYMTHRILDLAKNTHTPVQIHTGLHAGNGNTIENSNPVHLNNLFLKYSDVDFILFHGGYPYGGELSALAKNFRNVYIDMCWLHIISPSYSTRYLHEWLETVPANKIMAFGGDFHNVEGVYGHLLFARQVVAKVLIEKVRDGYFSEDEAKRIASMLMRENAIRVLKLNRISLPSAPKGS